eukprot:TRINITY_DN6251_c0_g1_i1.p1 TRINITY_DN6251_c0_g1~~TRINITY_DN6251_c0_g1_i1.p1  ORF type:complete len:542 (-),score=122.28 TRINITY_DN6251_c0_g1_i1:209-1834(-)
MRQRRKSFDSIGPTKAEPAEVRDRSGGGFGGGSGAAALAEAYKPKPRSGSGSFPPNFGSGDPLASTAATASAAMAALRAATPPAARAAPGAGPAQRQQSPPGTSKAQGARTGRFERMPPGSQEGQPIRGGGGGGFGVGVGSGPLSRGQSDQSPRSLMWDPPVAANEQIRASAGSGFGDSAGSRRGSAEESVRQTLASAVAAAQQGGNPNVSSSGGTTASGRPSAVGSGGCSGGFPGSGGGYSNSGFGNGGLSGAGGANAISPTSMAAAAAADDDGGGSGPLVPCPDCGRKFLQDRIGKHVAHCKKVFMQKRKQFNSAESRLGGMENAHDLIANANKLEKKRASEKKGKDSGVAVPEWKKQSLSFRAAILAAKAAAGDEGAAAKAQEIQQTLDAAGGADSHLLKCPHCSRTFNKEAGERHIAICVKTFGTKPGGGRLIKGGGRVAVTTPSRPALGSSQVSSPAQSEQSPTRAAPTFGGGYGAGLNSPGSRSPSVGATGLHGGTAAARKASSHRGRTSMGTSSGYGQEASGARTPSSGIGYSR